MYMYTKILRLRERWKYQRWEITSLSAPGLSPPQPGTKGPGEGPQSPFYRGRILHEPLYLSLSTKKKTEKNDRYCQQYSQPLFWGINIANTYVYPPTEWLGPMNWPHRPVFSLFCAGHGGVFRWVPIRFSPVLQNEHLRKTWFIYVIIRLHIWVFQLLHLHHFLKELISDFSSANITSCRDKPLFSLSNSAAKHHQNAECRVYHHLPWQRPIFGSIPLFFVV